MPAIPDRALDIAFTPGGTIAGTNVQTALAEVATDYAAADALSQPVDPTLTAFAALTIAASSLTIGTGADAFSQTTFAANTFPARASTGALVAKTVTDFALTFLDDADAATVRTTLGAGTSSFSGAFSGLSGIPTTLSGYGITDAQPLDSDLTVIAGLTATTDNFLVSVSSAWASRTPAQVRTTLGLVIGTNVQAWDATLDAVAGLTIAANSLSIGSGADAFTQTTFAANTFPARSSSGNLVAKTVTDAALTILDDTTVGAICTTLGAAQLGAANAFTVGGQTITGTADAAHLSIIPYASIGASTPIFQVLQTNAVAGFYVNNFGAVGFAHGLATVDSSGNFSGVQMSSGTKVYLDGGNSMIGMVKGMILKWNAGTSSFFGEGGTGGCDIGIGRNAAGILEVNNGTAGTLAKIYASNKLLAKFDHYTDAGNTTTTETDLYSDTTTAAQLGANGDKLDCEYAGVFVSSGTATREIKLYFAGTAIFDSGALTLSLAAAWTLYATIIRVSATVVRYMVSMTTEGAALAAYTSAGEVTGLTLSGTNIMKITGQAAGVGAATNDIVAKMGRVRFDPAV